MTKKTQKDYDFHFVYKKPNPTIEAFLEEASKDDRKLNAHFERILKERYAGT